MSRNATKMLSPLLQIWLKFAHAVGRINSFIILSLFYMIVMGIVRLLLVLTRKDLLDIRRNKKDSYWKERDAFPLTRENLLNPY